MKQLREIDVKDLNKKSSRYRRFLDISPSHLELLHAPKFREMDEISKPPHNTSALLPNSAS